MASNHCDENGLEKDQSSNINQVSLKRLDFDAGGLYYCEVSTDTPIFTKASNEEQLHVILSQTGPPKINLEKRLYYVGEKLIANCTTSKARPSPHITWLIDGKMVDDKYTKQLHPYSSGGKNSHRSKSHQQNNPSYEKSPQNSEIYKGMVSTKENPYELPDPNSNDNMGFEIHPPSGYNLDNNFEIEYNKKESLHNQQDFYLENKYFNTRKHRNSKKYRRYVNDGGEKKSSHKLMVSSSQLNIDIAKLLPNNGRLEITCLATIPAHVEIGEEFADYKTSSVRIDIETPETTSLVPSRIGASALDGNHGTTINFSKHNYRIIISLLCLPLLRFIIN